MARPGDPLVEGHGGLFGAPVSSSGTRQGAVDADLVIMPGGLLLVEQSSPLATCEGFDQSLTGDINCDNGRE